MEARRRAAERELEAERTRGPSDTARGEETTSDAACGGASAGDGDAAGAGAQDGPRGRTRAATNAARSAARAVDGAVTGGPAAPQHKPFDAAAFEALVGGRLIAWIGGAALVLGLALLAGIAVSNGWFGAWERTGAAAAISAALALAGLRIKHHITSNALLAAAIGGGFVTAGMAGPVHQLIPGVLAALIALAVGAAGTAIAVQRDSQGIAALGLLGGLAAPLLFGAVPTGGTAVLVLAASASAAGVLVWQRWSWLRAGLLLLALPQIAFWALTEATDPLGVLAVLAGFAVVSSLAAIGWELRAKGAKPSPVSALILLVVAAALAVVGWFACAEHGQETLGHCWLLALAVAHVVAGLALRRTAVNREVTLLLIGVGVVLGDIAAASMLDGLVLGLVWTGSAAGAAYLVRCFLDEDEQLLALTGMAGHLVLALAHAFVAVSPEALGAGTAPLGAFELALAGTTASLIARSLSRTALPNAVALSCDAIGIASLVFLTGVLLDGGPLVAALAAEAVALQLVGRRDARDAGVAKPASFIVLGFASVLAIVLVTPPTLLADGFPRPADAALALGALAAAAVKLARGADRQLALGLHAGAALSALTLASGLVVGAVSGGEQGQLALTVLWALAGVGGLAAGIALRRAEVRLTALVLLLVTTGKVFVVDLATLTSIHRVGALVGLGLLLLLGALVWQYQARRGAPREGTPLS
ncbi:DUF2339 domain-containing protein [Conexibacter stalactiti]|uniref:DUF2339 domain-containing protein n=1 Tax=Conexibacter stalactiti TaxID=1940611 RepID=A0ABU4HQC4_9ACTN|nr:DUF2339 domain-containing protein [Conexibacter stalactiti]MDW5594755.1 DUF2339 domain-containing protein [Conexibacter stalactiti]MEC5035397.1 DUF2339 domain-containing protein [Conexibacter stalactiti]